MNRVKNKTEAMLAKQSNDIGVRAAIIDAMLGEFKRNKFKPKNRTAISKLLADRISVVEGRACSNTTLLRSKVYGAQIDKFMVDNGYGGLQKKNVHNGLLSTQLEIRELRKENEQLNQLLQKSQTEIALLEHGVSPISKEVAPLKDNCNRFIKIIHLMVEKFDAIIDVQLRTVRDNYDDSILFDGLEFPEYFEWLETTNLS